MKGSFKGLKPEERAKDIIEEVKALSQYATTNLQTYSDLIWEYGTTPLKLAFLLQQSNGYYSYTEIIRHAHKRGIPTRSAELALTRLVDDGYVVKLGSKYRFTVENDGKI